MKWNCIIYQLFHISLVVFTFFLGYVFYNLNTDEKTDDFNLCIDIKLGIYEPGVKCSIAFLIGGLIGDSNFMEIGSI